MIHREYLWSLTVTLMIYQKRAAKHVRLVNHMLIIICYVIRKYPLGAWAGVLESTKIMLQKVILQKFWLISSFSMNFKIQKQSLGGVLKKGALKDLETLTQVFFCEFCEIFYRTTLGDCFWMLICYPWNTAFLSKLRLKG